MRIYQIWFNWFIWRLTMRPLCGINIIMNLYSKDSFRLLKPCNNEDQFSGLELFVRNNGDKVIHVYVEDNKIVLQVDNQDA